MPVIGRREGYSIDRGVIQNASHIVVGFDCMPAAIAPELLRRFSFRFVTVADTGELDTSGRLLFKLNKTGSMSIGTSSHADDRDTYLAVQVLSTDECGSNECCCRCDCGGLKDIAASFVAHVFFDSGCELAVL